MEAIRNAFDVWAHNSGLDHMKVSEAVMFLALGTGFVSHQFFKRFEPDPISYATFTLNQAVVVGAALYLFAPSLSVLGVVGWTAHFLVLFNLSLLTTIIVYRVAPWHPLSKYPGPIGAKISKLFMWKQAKLGRTGYTQAQLHDLYKSDVVRVGPNWISIRSAEVIPTIYGGSKGGTRVPWSKSDWNEGALRGGTHVSLQQEVDIDKHALRRKLWDQGFSGKALADYKPEILTFCEKLVQNIGAAADNKEEIDLGLQFHCLSFDVMGVLGFGESFGMLELSRKHFFVETLERAMRVRMPLHELPWFRVLLRKVLPLPERAKKFEQQNIQMFEKRLAQGSTRRDIFTYLLGEEAAKEGGKAHQFTRPELISDTSLVVVAGSDTTSSLLCWFWYFNIANPSEYKKLLAEVDSLEPEQLDDTAALAKLPYLNAALNETMRMQPAVPGGLRRIVPEGGAMLDGKYFVPEGTAVSVPTYALHHDRRYWGEDHAAYRPERWTSDIDKPNRSAYIPFSYGSRVCPGKNLALMEARLAVVSIASNFSFTFAPGFSQKAFEKGVQDHFTIQNMPLPVIAKRRRSK